MIDGQSVTDEDRTYAQLLLTAPAPMTAAAPAAPGQLPLRDLLAAGVVVQPPLNGSSGPCCFPWTTNMPAAVAGAKGVEYALQEHMASTAGGLLPFAVGGSVPSIQAGGFVMAGVSALALEGTAIGSCGAGGGGAASSGLIGASAAAGGRPGSAGGGRRAGGMGAIRLTAGRVQPAVAAVGGGGGGASSTAARSRTRVGGGGSFNRVGR